MRSVAKRTPVGPRVDPAIFKSYDIRGIVPDQLNPEVARVIGRAFRSEIAGPTVALGRDMRTHSDQLAEAVCQGLIEGGCHVVDVGRVSTDALYFAVGHLGTDGGMMVTASHNPPEYNGFKMCRKDAEPLSGTDGINRIQEVVSLADWDQEPGQGKVESREILSDFAAHVLSFIEPSKIRSFKVVIDAGNGMAGVTVPMVFGKLPCEVIHIYFYFDGIFE